MSDESKYCAHCEAYHTINQPCLNARGHSELPATPCSARWQSCALWPDGGTSSDEHDTKAQASAACRVLKRDGMGGLQEVFPTKTWVVPPKDEPKERKV